MKIVLKYYKQRITHAKPSLNPSYILQGKLISSFSIHTLKNSNTFFMGEIEIS